MQENTFKIKSFINDYAFLFWYTPDNEKENISREFLVEQVLNYGDINAVRKLFKIIGINDVARIFFNALAESPRKKGNYQELTINYFTLLLDKYACRDSK
jgi:hypothetical protein